MTSAIRAVPSLLLSTVLAMALAAPSVRAADPMPIIGFGGASQTVSEDKGVVNLQYTVDWNGIDAADREQQVVPFTVDGTATGGGVDHTLFDGNLVIETTTVSGAIDFVVVDDGLAEELESVVVTLIPGDTYELGAIATHQVNILDNDIPVVSWAAESQQVAENGGLVTITATLSVPSVLDVEAPFTVGGTAAVGEDHELADGAVAIPAGETLGSVTFAVVDDDFYEISEVIVVTLGTPVNAGLGTPAVHTVAIVDNDPQAMPTVSWATSVQSVREGAGAVTLRAVVSAMADVPIVVPYTVEGTAVAGEDHDLSGGEVVIAPGKTTAPVIFTVTDDLFFEDDETVIVVMGTPENAALGLITVHTVSIVNDDAQPVVEWETDHQTVPEDIPSVTLTAVLDRASNEPVVAPYTVSGTADGDGVDHDLADGAVTIPAGDTSAPLIFNLNDDALKEADETVVVTMGTPVSGAAGETIVHEVVITDNDLDTIPPVIQLIGDNPLTVPFGGEFEDPGAVATDNLEGDITDRITVDENVNPKVEGTYRVAYNVADESGNAASEVVRIVHVTRILDLYNVSSVAPVGYAVNQNGAPLPDVRVTSDATAHEAKTDEEGFFTYAPLHATGRVYFLTFAKEGYVTISRRFSGEEELGNVVLVERENPSGYDILFGTVTSYRGTPVAGAVVELQSVDFPAVAFSDREGRYTIAVDRRALPYDFDIYKEGYVPNTAQVVLPTDKPVNVVLTEKTRITVAGPATTEAHTAAREENVVEIQVSAVPPFNGDLNEFIIDEPANAALADQAYIITHAPYESFSLTLHADTSEDRNATRSYGLTREISFSAVPGSAGVATTSDTLEVTPGYPLILQSADEDSLAWVAVPADGLQGTLVPEEVRLVLTEYTDAGSGYLVGPIVRVEATDPDGLPLGGYPENPDAPLRSLYITLGYAPPLTREGIEDGSDAILRGETVQTLFDGDGAILPADRIAFIDARKVTFRVDGAGVYGFFAAVPAEEEQGLTSGGSGSSCFLSTSFGSSEDPFPSLEHPDHPGTQSGEKP